jgi:hypothetical protein
MDVRLSPLAVSIDDIALTDFYTRLILNAQGGAQHPRWPPSAARRKPRPMPEARRCRVVRSARRGGGRRAPPAGAPPPCDQAHHPAGRQHRLQRPLHPPNYDANLTGMGGRLVGLSSDPDHRRA